MDKVIKGPSVEEHNVKLNEYLGKLVCHSILRTKYHGLDLIIHLANVSEDVRPPRLNGRDVQDVLNRLDEFDESLECGL